MSRIIIACGTLRRELQESMEKNDCHDPVIWLKAGAHNVPKARLSEIKSALEKCEGYDTVLLCMTFCGNSLMGLNSGAHRLVIPRFDDCLTLLLGGGRRRVDTYYLNEGWLSGNENLLTEYATAMEKYGQPRADRIFSAMLKNYRRMVWLGHSPAPDSVMDFSAHFSLELSEEKPDISLFDKLLNGDWDEQILVLPPHSEIILEMRKGAAFYV
jgi:hypothetical protein